MKGIRLSRYVAELSPYQGKDIFADSLSTVADRLMKTNWVQQHGWQSIEDTYTHIPFPIYKSLCSFDEICKLYYSSIIMMDIHRVFEKHFQYEIIRKLVNSMWRWEYADKTSDSWNNLIDAYSCIRSVKAEGFDITLDYTTSYNERGYSKFSRTFLDGVFGFLVHYKGEHVMTIGFTILSSHRLLINQIQLVKKTGNRFLFKLGKDRVEWVLDLFNKYFNSFSIYLIDGQDLADSIRKQYQNRLDECKEYYKEAKERLKSHSDNEHEKWRLNHYSTEMKEYKGKLKEFDSFTCKHIRRVYGTRLSDYRRFRGITRLRLHFNSIKPIKRSNTLSLQTVL